MLDQLEFAPVKGAEYGWFWDKVPAARDEVSGRFPLALASLPLYVFLPQFYAADMGVLLAFMFVWNMVGAVILIPALSHFLLRNVGQPSPATVQERSDA